MGRHIWKRALLTALRLLLLLVVVSGVAFALVAASPLDPVEAYVGSDNFISSEQRANIVEYWGLNDPPLERYLKWAGNTLRGDLGTSLIFRRPVVSVIGQLFMSSLLLMFCAWALSAVIGYVLGLVAGMNEGKPLDRLIKGFCLLLASTPTFWFGLLALIVFAINLRWFPIGLSTPIGKVAEEVTWGERLHHLFLPALTLGVSGVANITLYTREELISVLNSDFATYALARGESRSQLLMRHGIRNTLVPAVTLSFASFGELFGGSILAEQVFSYPGLGSATTAAALQGDVPLLLAITLFSAVFVFTGNLLANILQIAIDPRVREGFSHGH